ncbi:transporter [Limibaculum sp. M0105]|uniref:Transporter n=1 Tax=Thermohalobaculum xanthum TaxID=2753746 RepID=A0A8J7M6D5_9RHOB|nr:transporter [Thermohalobaculum xanthum]MBK0398550.1 transporter [Thermohalobaculum xanthum]
MKVLLTLAISTNLTLAGSAIAQEALDLDDLAQELANPLASLVSIPLQMNWDRNIGPQDAGDRLTTNIQPVIPFGVTEDWNLITRTIVPVTWQEDIFPGAGSQFGLGDMSTSLFLSPSKITEGGFTWGVGPILLLPTATDDLLGAEKWGAGPTAVGLVQRGPWTAGALVNHVWSFAGDGDRSDINRTFMQPFAAYTTDTAWTFSIQSESAYDWTANDWAVPVNVSASKMLLLGGLPVSLQGGVGYWATAPDNGPEGFRFRLQFTLLFPR